MKKFDINNFVIDKVFKAIDKKIGRKKKKDPKPKKVDYTPSEPSDDVYTITIE